MKRRVTPGESADEEYALLFGSFLEGGGTFDYYEAQPVAFGQERPDSPAQTLAGTLWSRASISA